MEGCNNSASPARTAFVEPFFLRCETCRARLRVRDERFLGQVQSCPKCGSMVHIIAPAGWLAASEAAQAPTAEPAEVAAAAAPSVGAQLVGMVREHSILWTSGAATALVACGLFGMWTLGGSGEVETPVASIPIDATPQQEPVAAEPPTTPPVREVATTNPSDPIATTAAPVVPTPQQEVAQVEPPAPPPTASPPTASVSVSKSQKPRTLTLEPVAEMATSAVSLPASVQVHDYPPAIEEEPVQPAVKPPAAAPPSRVTNFKDQLSLPIEEIDLPAMPIGEFVNLMSGMTAVRIELDAKVLGDVGLSSRSTVTVRGEKTTAGKLLARVLKEQGLTCAERDGALVVVKAKAKN
jgi:hypothetical protein